MNEAPLVAGFTPRRGFGPALFLRGTHRRQRGAEADLLRVLPFLSHFTICSITLIYHMGLVK
jgi:hypothetical protein